MKFAPSLAALHLLQHPFYQDWMAGKLSAVQLKDYACQYYHHVNAFPRYLSAAHSQVEDAATRKILLENLNEEEGFTYGKSHPELWLDFAEGLGVSRAEVLDSKPRSAIQNVTSTFFSSAKASAAEGLGAIYAYEQQVPEIAESKISGLKEQYGITEEKTLAFFTVHQKADVFHREALEKILANLEGNSRAKAEISAERAARSLWDFLTDVHQHAA